MKRIMGTVLLLFVLAPAGAVAAKDARDMGGGIPPIYITNSAGETTGVVQVAQEVPREPVYTWQRGVGVVIDQTIRTTYSALGAGIAFMGYALHEYGPEVREVATSTFRAMFSPILYVPD